MRESMTGYSSVQDIFHVILTFPVKYERKKLSWPIIKTACIPTK